MNTLEQRVQNDLSGLKHLNDWEERYKRIIQMGKELAPMPEEYKTEANKVKGCQSQVWLFARLHEGKVLYYGDSDASIVKGLVALILKVYHDASPAEILAFKPQFIDELGLRQHLSMSRANGLNAMLKQVQLYALAFAHQLKR
jgi:cysteine desulfuration protein SufE